MIASLGCPSCGYNEAHFCLACPGSSLASEGGQPFWILSCAVIESYLISVACWANWVVASLNSSTYCCIVSSGDNLPCCSEGQKNKTKVSEGGEREGLQRMNVNRVITWLEPLKLSFAESDYSLPLANMAYCDWQRLSSVSLRHARMLPSHWPKALLEQCSLPLTFAGDWRTRRDWRTRQSWLHDSVVGLLRFSGF